MKKKTLILLILPKLNRKIHLQNIFFLMMNLKFVIVLFFPAVLQNHQSPFPLAQDIGARICLLT